MELWEFHACLQAFDRRQRLAGQEQLAISWQTANLTGAAFGGKLRSLSHYLKRAHHAGDGSAITAPQVSREEFEQRLKLFRERRNADGT